MRVNTSPFYKPAKKGVGFGIEGPSDERNERDLDDVPKDVLAGFYVRDDGRVNPVDATAALSLVRTMPVVYEIAAPWCVVAWTPVSVYASPIRWYTRTGVTVSTGGFMGATTVTVRVSTSGDTCGPGVSVFVSVYFTAYVLAVVTRPRRSSGGTPSIETERVAFPFVSVAV
mgnify:CR=1 FL=1